jgi:hypothetical protein
VGYCGLDRQRQPISGDEIRACWESRPEPVDALPATGVPTFVRTPVPRRDFIEVAEPVTAAAERRTRKIQPTSPEPELAPPVVTPRWSLWEDAEA